MIARGGRLGRSYFASYGRSGRPTIEPGTTVTLKPEAFGYGRPHLLAHARRGDVGVVAGPPRQSPAMARLYLIVHFEACGHDHRLNADEVIVVDELGSAVAAE
jgi:hypothetical protein